MREFAKHPGIYYDGYWLGEPWLRPNIQTRCDGIPVICAYDVYQQASQLNGLEPAYMIVLIAVVVIVAVDRAVRPKFI